MKTILLATNQPKLGRVAFGYAIRLCLATQSRLCVMQPEGGWQYRFSLSRLGIMKRHRYQIEKLFFLAESKGIPCELVRTKRKVDLEMPQYISDKRNVLMAIYEAKTPWFSKRTVEAPLMGQIPVPLVIIQNSVIKKLVESIKQHFKEGIGMKRIFSKLFSGSTSEKSQQVQANAADSEMKITEHKDEPARLVVVGNESHFSDSVINYGLEMAERMEYQIIALNTAPMSCNTFRIFKDTTNQLCQNFEQLSKESAAVFEMKAKEKGIPFTHVVKFVETDEALEQIQQEFGEIGFIISEPETQQAAYQDNENQNQVRQSVCVYSMR